VDVDDLERGPLAEAAAWRQAGEVDARGLPVGGPVLQGHQVGGGGRIACEKCQSGRVDVL
jgi:hypothetical protein